jgi:hypothetical protein
MTSSPPQQRIPYRDPVSKALMFEVDPVAKTIIIRLRNGSEGAVAVDAVVKLAYSENAVVVVLPPLDAGGDDPELNTESA